MVTPKKCRSKIPNKFCLSDTGDVDSNRFSMGFPIFSVEIRDRDGLSRTSGTIVGEFLGVRSDLGFLGDGERFAIFVAGMAEKGI